MKLLIVTQVVDTEHPILGFFHRWIEEFAQHCEYVQVICLQAGKHSLPANVTVHSLGKESGATRLQIVARFYKYIWQLRREYDNVFVHMNQIYVILGAPFWRAAGKRISLWYVHRQVTSSLRCAVLVVHRVFSSVPQSMRVNTNKVRFVGHGIDVDKFAIPKQLDPSAFHIVHIGRITRIKNIDVLIHALAQLIVAAPIKVSLYGEPVTADDKTYQAELQQLIADHNLQSQVTFCGSVANADIPHILATANMSVNLTPTGGLDKAVIESAAAGVPVVTSNQSYAAYFKALPPEFILPDINSKQLAASIAYIRSLSEEEYKHVATSFKQLSQQFSVKTLVSNMISKV